MKPKRIKNYEEHGLLTEMSKLDCGLVWSYRKEADETLACVSSDPNGEEERYLAKNWLFDKDCDYQANKKEILEFLEKEGIRRENLGEDWYYGNFARKRDSFYESLGFKYDKLDYARQQIVQAKFGRGRDPEDPREVDEWEYLKEVDINRLREMEGDQDTDPWD